MACNEILNPASVLQEYSTTAGLEVDSKLFAEYLDSIDELREIRNEFYYPKNRTLPLADLTLVNGDEESLYLCGNSLGLCPKRTEHFVNDELRKWQECGVHGHLHGKYPWLPIGEIEEMLDQMSKVVGSKPSEIAIMNTLTVNLHLLMVAFYKPVNTRHKILMEYHSFISDHVAIESQLRYHGYTKESIILAKPRKGEEIIRTEDILDIIEKEGDAIAVILFGGVQYYTGQKFDMKTITDAGHQKGCKVGFDLAHAVGNIELKLHEWDVDFACWCSYKYLNAGPGAIAGIFVHDKYDHDKSLTHFAGWWSVDKKTRFIMDNDFTPLLPGARGFEISNPSVMSIMPLFASLEIFDKVGMERIIKKQELLTGYLEQLIQHTFHKSIVTIITPADPRWRGCQLSLSFAFSIDDIHNELEKRGVSCDVRRPNVIRIAPAPLYNSFLDVYRFTECLKDVLVLFQHLNGAK